MKKVWKKATVLLLCVTILTTSVVYNYQTKDKNAKTANDVAKNEEKDEKENKGQKSKWKSKTKSNDEVKLLNANVSYNADSDGDGMTDAFETLNNMNPNVADTDGNGILDGKDTYTITYISQDEMTEDEAYLPSVEMTATGEQLQTLAIGAVDDNPLLCDKIPGYIGHAYNFTMDGEFEQATLNFEVDDSVDMKKEPTVYYYNEETQELEELKTTVKGHIVSAVTTHFSKYILVYKQDFNNFEEPSIDNPNDYIDLLSSHNLPIGMTFMVSPNISFEVDNIGKKYGEITTGYDTGYYDSMTEFFKDYADNIHNGEMIISINNLYGDAVVGVPNDDETEFEYETRHPRWTQIGHYRAKELREYVIKDIEDYNQWVKAEKMQLNWNYYLEDEDELKFNKMYISQRGDGGIRDNMNYLDMGIEHNNKYTVADKPDLKSVVYVISDIDDTENDLIGLMKYAKEQNISIYFIGLGTACKKEDTYKNAVNTFNNTYNVKSEENTNKAIGARYYYAKDKSEFTNVLKNQLMSDMLEDFELQDSDEDGLGDLHEYMIGEGEITTKTGVRIRDILDVGDYDEITNENSDNSDNKETLKYKKINYRKKDTDEDGIPDGDEIEVKKMDYVIGEDDYKDTRYKAIIHSDPTRKDTDGDGFDDKEEKDMGTNPMRYDITDVTLGYGARFAYCNVADYYQNKGKEYNKTIRELKKYSEEKEYFTGESYEALKNFEVVVANDSGDKEVMKSTQAGFDEGLGLTILKKKIDGKDNFIVCCRGTEPGTWHDLYTDAIIGSGSVTTYTQLEKAKEIIDSYAASHTGHGEKWFVTGHSLGGRLAQDVFLYTNVTYNAGATFNGLGYIKVDMKDFDTSQILETLGIYETFSDSEWLIKKIHWITEDIPGDDVAVFLGAFLLSMRDTNSYIEAVSNYITKYTSMLCNYAKEQDRMVYPYNMGSILKDRSFQPIPLIESSPFGKLQVECYTEISNNLREAQKKEIIKLYDNKNAYKQAKDKFASKYGSNKAVFNNYSYYQDLVGSRLGYEPYYWRIGEQNVYTMCTEYEYEYDGKSEKRNSRIAMCNENRYSIDWDTGYSHIILYYKNNRLGAFHSINIMSNTKIETRIREKVVNNAKRDRSSILNK